MTGAELVAALDTIGWSNRKLAKRLRCDEIRIRRWIQDVSQVPPSVAKWLSTLAAFHERHPAPTDWRVRK